MRVLFQFLLTVALTGFTSLCLAQELVHHQIQHDGIERRYAIYVPAAYTGSKPVPLMFNFHGYTGTHTGHMVFSGDMRPQADSAGFILVYPLGSQDAWGKNHWNVGSWTSGSSADDIGFTIRMIDTLSLLYSIDLDRVYSCGYSNGGYFSFVLACELSDRIAAVASVGGTMSVQTFNSCSPVHPTPVMTIHGTEDAIVSYYGGQPGGSMSMDRVNSYWNEFNKTDSIAQTTELPDIVTTDGSVVRRYVWANGLNETSVEHLEVVGGGHDWIGMWGNRDTHASQEIWDFVSLYDINGRIGRSWDPAAPILLYPNPAGTSVTVQASELYNQMLITDLSGRTMYQGTALNQPIDIAGWNTGIYLVTISGKAGSLTRKLVVD